MYRTVLALTWTSLIALALADFSHFVIENEDDLSRFQPPHDGDDDLFADECGGGVIRGDYDDDDGYDDDGVSNLLLEGENTRMLQFLTENGYIDVDALRQMVANDPSYATLMEHSQAESGAFDDYSSCQADNGRELFSYAGAPDTSHGLC